jgi:hypothetical protein
MMRALTILLTYLLLVGAAPVRAQQTLPHQSATSLTNPGKNAAEQWVWDQVQKGEDADLKSTAGSNALKG